MQFLTNRRRRRLGITATVLALFGSILLGKPAVAEAHDPSVNWSTCVYLANAVHDAKGAVVTAYEADFDSPQAQEASNYGVSLRDMSLCVHHAGAMGMFVMVYNAVNIFSPRALTQAEACRELTSNPIWGDPNAMRGFDVLCVAGLAVHNSEADPSYLQDPKLACQLFTSNGDLVVLFKTPYNGITVILLLWRGQQASLDGIGWCRSFYVGVPN